MLIVRSGTQGVSLGVRVVVFGADGAVFLVRHSYLDGWYFPGGGVDRGELLVEAAKRELCEEARIISLSEPQLLGIYLNDKRALPDYIACYVVKDWRWDSATGERPDGRSLDGEIIESGFFDLDELPDGISIATRARLKEIAEGADAAHYW
ncbi:NUDIX domain-containing protein [Cohaesibacter celericrescens]|uniref:NUDIX domain-containing protein n=1 Tax=Cohaesibacter celericrescens TaxID=2067669 RepID=UPI003567024F